MSWQLIATAPRDGTHILVCDRSDARSTFQERPPTVVHWFDDGFYTSVNELAPQYPYPATHWKSLGSPP